MTSSNGPLITIVLATFNSEESYNVESVIEQGFPLSRVRLIIVDSGSKDNKLR
jgi:glycosyltransferase involved in cell wall biosynthesis